MGAGAAVRQRPQGELHMARCFRLVCAAALVASLVPLGAAVPAIAASPEEIDAKLKALQEQVDALRRELEKARQSPQAGPPPAPAVGEPPKVAPATSTSWISDFKIGGYGSTRFEASDLDRVNNTFTFRRFVLSGDATIANRLRSVVEVEFERLTELEVEKSSPSEGGLRGFSNSIESSDQSEISLEQAWMQFTLADWARFRAGMLLVPLGRFNLNHDDNRWDLPRRSLVDRGAPVLPVKAAWDELGAGVSGEVPVGDQGSLGYQLYVVNGAVLQPDVESVLASGDKEGGKE